MTHSQYTRREAKAMLFALPPQAAPGAEADNESEGSCTK